MTLENKLGLTSSAELACEEERISKKKAVELFENGTLDFAPAGKFETLKTIHKFLFEDIYDFAGNVAEWTQEQQKDSNNQAIRGGSSKDCFPVGKRRYGNPNENCHYAGFRAALWLR